MEIPFSEYSAVDTAHWEFPVLTDALFGIVTEPFTASSSESAVLPQCLPLPQAYMFAEWMMPSHQLDFKLLEESPLLPSLRLQQCSGPSWVLDTGQSLHTMT